MLGIPHFVPVRWGAGRWCLGTVEELLASNSHPIKQSNLSTGENPDTRGSSSSTTDTQWEVWVRDLQHQGKGLRFKEMKRVTFTCRRGDVPVFHSKYLWPIGWHTACGFISGNSLILKFCIYKHSRGNNKYLKWNCCVEADGLNKLSKYPEQLLGNYGTQSIYQNIWRRRNCCYHCLHPGTVWQFQNFLLLVSATVQTPLLWICIHEAENKMSKSHKTSVCFDLSSLHLTCLHLSTP